MEQYPTIQAQIDSINKATEEAAKSKESAIKFLFDAGIITDSKPAPPVMCTSSNESR